MTPPATVLLVDDQPAGLTHLADYLTHAGYEVLVAENGHRALQQVRATPPDLVLLDLVMPELDGFAVLHALRLDPALAAIPTIVMTSQTDLSERLRVFAAGAVDYVTKPFFPEEVLARVQTHLRLRALQRELEQTNQHLEDEVRLRLEAEAQLQQSLDRAVVVATPDGRIQLCTLLARRWLETWFGAPPAPEQLPTALTQWLACRGEGDAAAVDAVFRRRSEHAELCIRRFADPLSGDCVMLLLDERRADSPAALGRLGLSPRETEVLYWLAEGKSYKEIGVILGCESRTAQKHAERIFAKLGVENRHAAALVARETLAP